MALGELVTRCRGTGRRQVKRFLVRFGFVAEFMVELDSLRRDVGVLQLEKGNLEAEIRTLQHNCINPPEPYPPSNPVGYVPAEIPVSGQAYRDFLADQLYGTTTPTITGVATDGEFLQVGLGRYGDGKFGPRWIAVDLYDPSPAVDYHHDVHDLPLDWSGRFALVMCCAILEHIHYPQKAIDELYRVLAPSGFIYAELPFWQPYHSGGDSTVGEKYEFGGDFWRATVEGLRVWTAAFDEMSCGWANEGVVFFLGRKPA
ncbi:MAG: methyltransferase domain-containing protein [Solirubrobacteraceae bacterium]|jgi:SAM-dependent methyltransferase